MNAFEFALVIVFGALVVALFLLALAEASLLHVRRSEVAVAVNGGDGPARRLLALVDDLPRVMNAVLLAVLLCQVLATAIAGLLATRWFGSAGVTIATVAVTIVLFVYGEAIPKTLAIRHPYRVGRRLTRPIRSLTVALRPAVAVLVAIADVQLPGRTADLTHAVSEAELRQLTDEAASAGHIGEADADLIERSFTFGDLVARDVMVPWGHVVSVAEDVSDEAALRDAIAAGHRRLPVTRAGDPTRVVGFVRLRDLAEASTLERPIDVEDIVQGVITVDAAAPVADVVGRMQRSDVFLAVVVERARTVGIMTIEDAVRVLVGPISEP